MDLQRRFAFNATAAAIGGRLVLPSDLVLESGATSCLPISGGRSASEMGARRYSEAIALGAATAFAEGLVDDPAQGHSATTHAKTEIRDLEVGTEPKLTVKRAHAAMSSRSARGGGEAAIRVEDAGIEGIAIDGHRLSITFNLDLLRNHDTRSKLVAAADDDVFIKEHGANLFMHAELDGRPVPRWGRLVDERGVIHGTIVRKIEWDGAPYPGATIAHHKLVIPNFGRVFFGEIRITHCARRLTLMRLRLGSPVTGDVALNDVETNGSWSP